MAIKTVTPSGYIAMINDNFADLDSRLTVGTYTVVADDDTAGTVDIDSGLETATAFMVQIYRSGVMVMADAAVSIDEGILTIADGAATYALTADDVIAWIVF